MEQPQIFTDAWPTSLASSQRRLAEVPAEFLIDGPSYQAKTKKGVALTLTSQYYYCDMLNDFKPCAAPGDGLLLYLFAKNQAGEILETEQARWQHLYGEGGKYGIHKGRRTFAPQPTTTTP